MTDARLKRFLLLFSAAAAAAALFYFALRCLLPWLLPFLIAAAVAAAAEPAVRILQKRLRFRRSFASLLMTLFVLFLLGGLLSLFFSTLTGEFESLTEQLPGLLSGLSEAINALLERLEQYCDACPPWLRRRIEDAFAHLLAEAGSLLNTLSGQLLKTLGTIATALPALALGIATTVLAIYFTLSSWPDLCVYARERLPDAVQRKLHLFRAGMARSLRRWLRSELTLCAVTFVELLGGLIFLREPYALLLASLITLVDALPVFGTGTVLIPWAVIVLLLQNVPKAIFLMILYLITLTVRSVLEPRLLGAQAGLPPIASLLAMYLGFRTFGVSGMILFPFLLLLFAQLRRQMYA